MAVLGDPARLFGQLLWIDYAIAALLAFFLLMGLIRGAASETRSLLCWTVASAIGWFFAEDHTRLAHARLSDPKAEIAAAFGVLFASTLALGALLFLLRNFKDKRSHPSLLGHVAGLPVAMLRGLLFVNLIVVFAGLTPLPQDGWWHESKFLPHFENSVVWAKAHFPTGFSEFIRYS